MESEYFNFIVFGCIVIAFIGVSTYNRFIKYKNQIEEKWSSIDIALKRRLNIIPNMISAVKMYSAQETDIMEKTTQARHGSTGVAERSQDESAISQSLQGLLAVAEAYPDLKANTNYLALQQSLVDVENEILIARSDFNNAVRKNNTLVQSFPSNILAKIFHFRNAQYFALELATQRTVPEVK